MTNAPTTSALSTLEALYAVEAEHLDAGGPGAADFAPLAPLFSRDVVLHQAAGLPYGGTWRGHDGLERFFLAMSRTWDVFEMVEQRFLNGTSPIVVLTQVHARSRNTGRELDFPILQTVAVEGGRIVEVRPFSWDTATIAEAWSPAAGPKG
jgi:uncharacterized protein